MKLLANTSIFEQALLFLACNDFAILTCRTSLHRITLSFALIPPFPQRIKLHWERLLIEKSPHR